MGDLIVYILYINKYNRNKEVIKLYYEIFSYINIKNIICFLNVYNNINFIIMPKLINYYYIIYIKTYIKALSYIYYFFHGKY